jgi:hypothetical protein
MGVLFALSPAHLALEPIAPTNPALYFLFASHSSLACRVELYLIEKRSAGVRQNGQAWPGPCPLRARSVGQERYVTGTTG